MIDRGESNILPPSKQSSDYKITLARSMSFFLFVLFRFFLEWVVDSPALTAQPEGFNTNWQLIISIISTGNIPTTKHSGRWAYYQNISTFYAPVDVVSMIVWFIIYPTAPIVREDHDAYRPIFLMPPASW